MTILPAAPQNLRLFNSELSGIITVSFKPERKSSSNEAQVNLGDPNDEAGWVQKPLIRGGKAELTGLAPRIVVWVRVRTIGLKGVMGVWNGPAQIRTARCEGGAWFLVLGSWCGASRWPAWGRPSRSLHENNSPLTTHHLQLRPSLSASSFGFGFRVGWAARHGVSIDVATESAFRAPSPNLAQLTTHNLQLTTPPFAVSFLLLLQGWVGSSVWAGPRGSVDWIGLNWAD
jgi:hypothetical protein